MNLYSDVYQLLSENDCVIIPGFGGFVANYCEAEIDIAKQKFCPPARTLAFNQKLQTNDGLLINCICQTHGVSWQTAKESVADFVAELNAKLETENAVILGELGRFDINAGNLVFTPFRNADLLESSYGLGSFYFPLLKNENNSLQINKSKNKSTSKKHTKSGKKIVYIISVAAVLTSLVAISIHFDFFENINNRQHAIVVPVNKIVSVNSDFPDYKTVIGNEILYIDPELLNDEFTSENVVVTKVKEKEETFVEPIVLEETSKIAAYIIAGSFSSIENAENFQKKYISSGFPSEILPKSNGMYRISIKSYQDSSLAVDELSSLKNKTGNYSLWILKL